MKAVIITPKLTLPAYSGSDVLFYELCKALSNIGWDVELWTSDASGLEVSGAFDICWRSSEIPHQGDLDAPFLIERIPLEYDATNPSHGDDILSDHFNGGSPLAGDDFGLDWFMSSADRPSYSDQVSMLNGNGPSWGGLYTKLIEHSEKIDGILPFCDNELCRCVFQTSWNSLLRLGTFPP